MGEDHLLGVDRGWFRRRRAHLLYVRRLGCESLGRQCCEHAEI